MNVTKEYAVSKAEEYLPEILSLLEKICSVDSESCYEEGNLKVISMLEPIFERLGAKVEKIYEKGIGTHIVARVMPKDTVQGKIILAAHLDTVFPVGSAKDHPFYIKDGYAWGLGVSDCKSGVLIALFGALMLKEADRLPPYELTFIFNCDEEIGSPTGCKVFEREAKGADFALVFEGGREENGRTGFVTSRRGVILGDIDIKGKEAHAGAAYLDGRSAVLELAHQITRLYSFNDMEKEIYYNVAPISGGSPNGVVAGDAHAQFCVAGLPTQDDFAIVEKKLDSLMENITVDGCTVDVKYHTLFPAMERSEMSGVLFERVSNAARIMGLDAYEIADPCATDAAWLSSFGVPSIDALGALEYEIHTMNEHADIESIKERTALCALIIDAVCEVR